MIIVTGAAGFIGSCLVGRLNAEGINDIVVVDDFSKTEKSHNLEGKTLILADPMLATGQSLVSVFEGLKKHGTPKEIHVACVIGSNEGIEYIQKYFPKNTQLWIATVDEKLNNKGYIVPGLGDAGDLSFGSKLQF